MGNTFTNYTVKMQGIMEGIEDDFSSFYTKEDAEREIRTIARGQSSARRAKANLTEMLRGSGITPEWDSSGKLKNPEEVIGAFLDEEELEAKMYRKMHDVYLRFPTSENYLKRIIRKRIAENPAVGMTGEKVSAFFDAVENLLYFVTKCCSYDVRRHKFSYFSTLLNNAKRIALGHYPEVIMAWLQTMDTYYHDDMTDRLE